MKKFFFVSLVLSFLLLIGCPTETEDNPPDYNVLNIQYSDNTDCVMDIYRSDNTVRPAVMLIHGGAWITIPRLESSLGRSGMEQFKDFFLNNGFHVANIDYRLIKIASPDGTNYKDMLDDIRAAVTYLRNNANKYAIDTSSIVMYGYSAGAHLAELYSYKVTDSPIPVSLCVGRAGPADFWNEDFRKCDILGSFTKGISGNTDPSFALIMVKNMLGLPTDTPDDAIQNIIRCRIITNLLDIDKDVTSDLDKIIENPNNKSVIDDVSPIYHVTGSSPRTILLHGEKDTLVPISIAKSLDTKLTDCSVAHDFIIMPNSDHSLNNEQDADKLQEFDNKVLSAITDIKNAIKK